MGYDVTGSVSIGDVLREHRRSRGGLTAVVDGSVRLTYRELDDRVNRLSDSLVRGCGLQPGDRVLWLGQNSFRVIELLAAVAKIGASLIPANWRQSPEELAFVIEDVAPRLVVWQKDDIGEGIAQARSRVKTSATWVCHDSADSDQSYEDLLATGEPSDPETAVDPCSSVLGIYTAAFEGRPNAAMLSHWSLLVESLVVGRLAELSDETVFLNSGPMFHLGTLMTTLSTFVHGGTNVILARTDAEEVCRTVDAEGVNRAFIMAPTVEAIREVNKDGRWDVTSLWGTMDPAQWTMCTPSANPSTGRAGGYGQSEVTGIITGYGLGRKTLSTYGRPLPLGQVRIVQPDGQDAPDGEIGEIACRGPVVMNGYLNRDELNARRQRDGWHYTGDLGRREADGSITFVAPAQRMIKSASENVYPVEVERCLATHPAVADVCVLGVPDARWNQSVKALVVLEAEAEVTAEELIEYCRSRIASYKKPRYVEFVTAVPRQSNGQLDRERADAEYGGGGYPGQVSSGARHVPMKQG